MAQNVPKLYYFSSRGLTEIIRVILAETATAYEEVSLGVYNPASQPEPFQQLVASGKLPFSSVPLWEEPDGFSIVQSQAIVRYLARTKGLYGKNDREAARCDMIAEGFLDFAAKGRELRLADPSKKEEVLASLINKEIPKFLTFFENLLQKNNNGASFFVGDSLTYVDLVAWLTLENIENQGWNNYEKYPLLAAFKQRIESRPNIDAYRKSPKRFPVQYVIPPKTN